MKIERLFKIMNILLNKKVVTAKELARLCEVSARTIYRDIDTLTLANIPIYTNMGSNGGFSIDESYVLNNSYMNLEEQKHVMTALQSLKDTALLDSDAYIKLEALFKNKPKDWIEIDVKSWTSEKIEDDTLSELKEAILNNYVIELDYLNKSGEFSHRKIEPFKVLFKSADWYLIGYCLLRREQRTFKISRMKNLKICYDTFVQQEIKEQQLEIKDNSPDIALTLKFNKNLLSEIIEIFPIEELMEYDTYFILKTTFYHFDHLARQLLSYGSGLVVLEPETLRKEIYNQIDELSKLYIGNSESK